MANFSSYYKAVSSGKKGKYLEITRFKKCQKGISVRGFVYKHFKSDYSKYDYVNYGIVIEDMNTIASTKEMTIAWTDTHDKGSRETLKIHLTRVELTIDNKSGEITKIDKLSEVNVTEKANIRLNKLDRFAFGNWEKWTPGKNEKHSLKQIGF